MMETLYSSGMLASPAGLIIAGLIGISFGYLLEQAGFGSSRKLTAIFYFRDMTVLKVMFTAVVTAMVGFRYLVAFGLIDTANVHSLDTYWVSQALGGIILGLGFVIGGWCPGTAFVGIVSAKWDALIFVVGAILGSILFNEFYPLISSMYMGTYAGVIWLPESLGIPSRFFPLIFCMIAVIAFVVSTALERKFGDKKAAPASGRRRSAAGLLLILAAGLIFVVPPSEKTGAAGSGLPMLTDLLQAVTETEDHFQPIDLAHALMSGSSDYQVVDIRNSDEYDLFHIRGAINVPLSELSSRLHQLDTAKKIVLYSNGTTHAAQAWLGLRQSGYTGVYVLTDGILGFWRQCLTPPSLQIAADPSFAHAEGAAFRQRKAFFIDRTDTPNQNQVVENDVENEVAMEALGLESHLISAEWLSEKYMDSNVKIIDVRDKSSDYSTSHIPGARYINVENIRTTLNGVHSMMMPADALAIIMGQLGIKADDVVIVYADRVRDATYLGVALERLGHGSYAILNGGFQAWTGLNLPETSEIPEIKPVKYVFSKNTDSFTISIDEAYQAYKQGDHIILDTRPEDYYSGKKSDEARAGHIPGAINRPYSKDLITSQTNWKSLASLESDYSHLGLESTTRIIVHCRTGHQASQTYFLLKHLLGYKNVYLMDGSWMAWAARKDLPIAME